MKIWSGRSRPRFGGAGVNTTLYWSYNKKTPNGSTWRKSKSNKEFRREGAGREVVAGRKPGSSAVVRKHRLCGRTVTHDESRGVPFIYIRMRSLTGRKAHTGICQTRTRSGVPIRPSGAPAWFPSVTHGVWHRQRCFRYGDFRQVEFHAGTESLRSTGLGNPGWRIRESSRMIARLRGMRGAREVST